MMIIAAFIRRHPVLTYFALTFARSGGGMLPVTGRHGRGGRCWFGQEGRARDPRTSMWLRDEPNARKEALP